MWQWGGVEVIKVKSILTLSPSVDLKRQLEQPQTSYMKMMTWMMMLCDQGVEVQALLDDVRKLKIIAKGHERRIKYLEDRLAEYEDVAASIDDHIDEQME